MEIHQQIPVDEIMFYTWKDWATFNHYEFMIVLSHFLDTVQGISPIQTLEKCL